MWNSLQSPNSEESNNMLDASPTGNSAESPIIADRMLGSADSDDDSDADYIPPSLAAFVKQANATLESTKTTFLGSAAAAASPPEPSVFCFDEGGRTTPPLEDEQDRKLQSEMLERINKKVGDQRFDVEKILNAYSDNVPNDSEEVFFSPDMQTPPPNPHYNITSATEARKLALGSPALTVDTDVLPFRKPDHDDHSGSDSAADQEEDDGLDDAMAWLGSAMCDPNVQAIYDAEALRKPDPPSQRAAPQMQTPMDSTLPGGRMSFDVVQTPMAQQTPAPSQASKPQTPVLPRQPIEHVGDIDETEGQGMPPSSPVPRDATPTGGQVVPMEVTVQDRKMEAEKSHKPMEVSIEEKQKAQSQEIPNTISPQIQQGKVAESHMSRKEPLAENPSASKPQVQPTKSPIDSNISQTPPKKKSTNQTTLTDRLSRPTTASTTKAQANKKTPASSSRQVQGTPSTQSPAMTSSKTGNARTPQSVQRPLRSAAKPKQAESSTQTTPGLRAAVRTPGTTGVSSSTRTASPVRKSPPVGSSRTPRSAESKVARTNATASPGSSTRPSAQRSASASERSTSLATSQSSPPTTAARVTRTFRQRDSSQKTSASKSGASKEAQQVSNQLMRETTASKQRHTTAAEAQRNHPEKSPTMPPVSSRLLKETASSKQHHATAVKEHHADESPLKMTSGGRDDPEPHVPTRLLQETAASKLRHAAIEDDHAYDRQWSPSTIENLEPVVSGRLLQETEASKLRHAADAAAHATATNTGGSVKHIDHGSTTVSSRLLQETEASKKRYTADAEAHATSMDSNGSAKHMYHGSTTVSSRLLRETTASKLRHGQLATPAKSIGRNVEELQASREKARERARQHMAREKMKENSDSKAAPMRHQKFSPDDGVARAKERLRQRQLKERQEREKENLKKVNTSSAKRQSFVGLKEKRSRPLTIPQGPKLSTSRRTSSRGRPPASVNSADSERRVSGDYADMSLAQGTDTFRKGLRSDDEPRTSTASTHRQLTIAKTPKFATSARYGEKPPPARWREQSSLASSTRLLQNQLRGEVPSLARERELKLTVPQAPKFHPIAKRAPAKSTQQLEEEIMKELNSHPFKALPYRPNAPNPADPGRKKPSPRTSTIPKPFQLASDARAAAHSTTVEPERIDDQIEMKKQFHARPMPSFANSPQIKTSKTPRGLSPPGRVPEHSDRAISPPNLRTSSRAERRMVTVQAFNSHAEQSRLQKEADFKRRQREKHEKEIRQGEAMRAKAAASYRPAEAPFQLVSVARHEVYQQRLEGKRREQEEEQKKASTFHARPFRPAPTPEQKRSNKPTTSPEPFRLKSEERHATSQEKSRRLSHEAAEETRRQAQFRARPVPQTTYELNVNSPSAQPFLLATSARRQAYEEEKKKREEAELEELKKLSQFKARPVPHSTYEYTATSPHRPGYQNGDSAERNRLENAPSMIERPEGMSPPERPPMTIEFHS